jgi:ribosome-binding protein aMBF1 (putative translation factor)
MPLARVPTHANGHVITEPERQLQRLLLAGETTARSADLMGLSRQEVADLVKSLRRKGLRPGARIERRARAKTRSRRRSAEESPLDPSGRRRFGAHLRTLRTARGMTQAALAGGAFTPAFVSMVESGVASPSMKSLVHFARRLDVSVREVIPPDL